MDVLRVGAPVATVWASPDAPRDLDAAAVADRPDQAAWLGGLSAEDRLGLHGRTLTQLLHSFDQVSADQVRAEAETLFRHPPTLAIAGAKVASRGVESLLSRW